ncbi:hypothetical protein D3C81_1122930 [compost metagenome]
MVVKVLRGKQGFISRQRTGKSRVACRPGCGFDTTLLAINLHVLNHQGELPGNALLPTVCYPLVGKSAQAVMHVHRAKLQVRQLLP